MAKWKEIMIEELTETYQNFFEGRTNLSKNEIAKLVEEKVKELFDEEGT